jgi:hypothetical protein
LIEIFHVLHNHDVPFVVIGGHAVNYHGYIRATEDADILFRRDHRSELTLFQALVDLRACWLSVEIDPATGIEKEVPVDLNYVRGNHLMMLCTRLGYLDIFDFVPGNPACSMEDIFATASILEGIRFASLSCLRKIKAASGRTRDLLDLENLPLPEDDPRA